MPKKGGKGGKGKGKKEQPKVPDEAELEAQRRERLDLFLKDRLQKEEELTAANLEQLNRGWREILLRAEDEELREEFEVQRANFERQLEGLDAVIRALKGDLRESERQLSRVRQLHLHHVDRLLALHHKRMSFLQQQWESGLQDIESKFVSKQKEMKAQQQQMAVVKDFVNAEHKHKQLLGEIHKLYITSITEYQDNHESRVNALFKTNEELSQALTERSHQMKEAWKDLIDKEMKQERQKERNDLLELAKGKIERVKQLQKLVINQRKIKEAQLEDLKDKIAQVKRNTFKLRDQMNNNRAAATKQLGQLSVASMATQKKLQAVIDKGESVLALAAWCCKLENQQLRSPDKRAASAVAEIEESDDASDSAQSLGQLMERYSAAVWRYENLKKNKEKLLQENEALVKRLSRGLDAMGNSNTSQYELWRCNG